MRPTDSGILGCILFAVASLVNASASAEGSDRPEQYGVAEIRAHAYYHARGEFDERDLFDPTMVLGNMIIGESDAKDPTGITLVLVTVEGPSFLSDRAGAVVLRAHAEGAAPKEQSMPFSPLFSKGTRVIVPFLIHDTGCSKLKLEAQIMGVPGNPQPKQATIPFFCGD
jgi:hypothetical protein